MGNTADEILKRMKARLIDPASTMEGSFTADNLQAVANELAEMHSVDYERLMDRSHSSTAEGEDLDVAARDNHGMTRNSATYETVTLLITGIPGTAIDETVGVKSDDVVYMVSGSYVIGADGTAEVTAVCVNAGAGYDVPAQTLTKFLAEYEGLESVTNETASSGGYDAETDDEFRARIKEREADPAGLYNIAWYRQTAKEVNGVLKAKVFDCARGNGTVDVVIIAAENKAASDVLVKRVYEHIEEERGIGADVKVESGSPVTVSVKASLYLKNGYSVSSVLQKFATELKAYFDDMDFADADAQNRVSYAKVMNLLINCEGVQDIGTLILNDQESSLVLDKREFAIAATPEFSIAEEG